MNQKEKIEQARELGRQAFHAGKKAIPAHDANLQPLLEGHRPGSGGSLPFLRAWNEGWHQANLAEPVKALYDTTGNILAFESGELDEAGVVELFQHLIDSGLAWQLQGCYGRQAKALINAGLCTPRKN